MWSLWEVRPNQSTTQVISTCIHHTTLQGMIAGYCGANAWQKQGWKVHHHSYLLCNQVACGTSHQRTQRQQCKTIHWKRDHSQIWETWPPDHGWGTELKAIDTNIYLAKNRIKHTTASHYHPQANGRVEQLNSSLVEALSNLSANNPKAWVDMLPTALMVCITQVNCNMGKSRMNLSMGISLSLLALPQDHIYLYLKRYQTTVTLMYSVLEMTMKTQKRKELRENQSCYNKNTSKLGTRSGLSTTTYTSWI